MTASTTASTRHSLEQLLGIAGQFAGQSRVIDVRPLGNGNINDTYRVVCEPAAMPDFILQRINTSVFQQPHHVMQNMCCMTAHVQQRLADKVMLNGRSWKVPRVLHTTDGQAWWHDEAGEVWRGISFIDDTVTFDTVQSHDHAWEIGYGLGTFHRLISDLPPDSMIDTLEGFHITPNYLMMYQQIMENNSITETADILFCTQFIAERADRVGLLEAAKSCGDLPVRPIHGDPKVNNILFDAESYQAIGLIDLDTVKPGLIQYDIGDCLRSGCNSLGEETADWNNVTFDRDLCENILQGYCIAAKEFLTSADYRYFYDAVWLISFELGLRFFTDYVSGNVYFKARYANHNLMRALVQFKLVESIEKQREQILLIVDGLADMYL